MTRSALWPSVSSAVFVAVLIACGGSVTSGSGVDGGKGNGSCTTTSVNGDRACVPGFATPNTPISIDVDATEGCLGCFTTLQPCKVRVNGDQINVGMEAQVCPPPGDQLCPAMCGLAKVTCTIPPLAVGTYTINVAGEPPTAARTRRLFVDDDPNAKASCTLDGPGTEQVPIDVNKFAKACTADDECVTVATSPCAKCECETEVISTSAKGEFEAERRARLSQCKPATDAIACGPCMAPRAFCRMENASPTGTCEIAH